GLLVPGCTSSSLLISNAVLSDADTYAIEVRGACNSVTNSGTLTVLSKFTASSLTDLDLCQGERALFSTTVSGSGTWGFAWRKNGQLLAGETNSSLAINSVTTSHAGAYAVEISGPCNRATNSATLLVHPPFTATPLANVAQCEGGSATFSTTVSGEAVTYRWRKDGTLIANQGSPNLMLSNLAVSAAGAYQVEISGRCNSLTNRATLTVLSNVSVSP